MPTETRPTLLGNRLFADVDPPRQTEDSGGFHLPAIVCLHGFTQNGQVWNPIRDGIRALMAEGTHPPYPPCTLAVDLPGHGGSASFAAAYSMDDCLNALEAVLDDAGIDQAWWVGYSMGGRVALQMAAKRPNRVHGLVLLSTTAGLEDASERKARIEQDERLALRLEAEGLEAFMDYWLSLPLFAGLRRLPPQDRAALRKSRLENSPDGLAASLRCMGTGTLPPVWADLPRITQPTVVMAGEEDAKFLELAQRMVQSLPNARLRVVGGAGHALPLEAPAQIIQAIVDTVRETERQE